jgi:hypothetical protein
MSPEQLFAALEIDLHRREAGRYTLDFGQRQTNVLYLRVLRLSNLLHVQTNDLR